MVGWLEFSGFELIRGCAVVLVVRMEKILVGSVFSFNGSLRGEFELIRQTKNEDENFVVYHSLTLRFKVCFKFVVCV